MLIKRVGKGVDNEGGFMVGGKKKLKFVEDVPVMCVNLIFIVIVVSEERKGVTSYGSLVPAGCFHYNVCHK